MYLDTEVLICENCGYVIDTNITFGKRRQHDFDTTTDKTKKRRKKIPRDL